MISLLSQSDESERMGTSSKDTTESTHYFALPAGSTLHEFEIEGVLGHGGFGITYRARDTLLDEVVAIKEFLPNELAVRLSDTTVRAKSTGDQKDFETGLKSFLQEARTIARFRHNNIVHVRRFFEAHGTGYIVEDYEGGQTLSQRLRTGPLDENELYKILIGVLDGLEVVHDQATLHRDLKPDNIILRKNGEPVLIDFGAARDFLGRHSRSITAIAAGGYTPPEQWGVGGQQGPWSDLYALGAVAYRCVTGSTPLVSLQRLRNDPLVPATKAADGKYNAELLRLIDWMLDIDEAKRPASVAAVRKALQENTFPQQKLEKETSQSRKPESYSSAATRPARWRMAVVAPVLVIASLAAAVAGYFYVDHQKRAEAGQKTKAVQEGFEAKLRNAGGDLSALERFLSECGTTCATALRSQGQASLELARQLSSDRTDERTLERLLAACGPGCPSDLINRVSAKVEALKTEQRRAAEEVRRTQDDCYRLAGSPIDTELPAGVTGVEVDAMDFARAIVACRKAVGLYPDDPRFAAQLGRALHASKNYSEALHFYQIAADHGHTVAIANLGVMYLNGWGVTKDEAEAARLFRRAGDLGNRIALRNLATLYLNGLGVPKNPEEAARLFRKASELGDTDALNELGKLYQQGNGVTKDIAEAVRLYRRSAELGNSHGMVFLGAMHVNGDGVAKDYGEALRFYRRAADLGNVLAIGNLGGMYEYGFGVPKDFAEAARLFRKAGDLGNAVALNELGSLYELGNGVPKDIAEAIRLYRRSAELGNADGIKNLGAKYFNGTGVPKDFGEAARLFRGASDLGNSDAMDFLGVMYANGYGVAKDYGEAVRFYRQAAELGNVLGIANLGDMYLNGLGVTRNDAEAAKLFRKAADLGNAVAMNKLGLMYAFGRGVPQNKNQAIRFLRSAIEAGDSTAKANLRLLQNSQ
jgi:TPR repeat protein/serine/threonine protein kinase